MTMTARCSLALFTELKAAIATCCARFNTNFARSS